MEEAKDWIERAIKDFDTANYLFDGKKYEECSFYCQQSVEKALKAVLLIKTGELRKVHDLFILGKEAKIPELQLNELKELSLAYVYSRYPDVPKLKDIKNKSHNFLNTTKEVLEWAKRII